MKAEGSLQNSLKSAEDIYKVHPFLTFFPDLKLHTKKLTTFYYVVYAGGMKLNSYCQPNVSRYGTDI